MSFDEYDEAHDFYDDIKNMIPKASPLPDDYASWHLCYHNGDPQQLCEVIEQWQPD